MALVAACRGEGEDPVGVAEGAPATRARAYALMALAHRYREPHPAKLAEKLGAREGKCLQIAARQAALGSKSWRWFEQAKLDAVTTALGWPAMTRAEAAAACLVAFRGTAGAREEAAPAAAIARAIEAPRAEPAPRPLEREPEAIVLAAFDAPAGAARAVAQLKTRECRWPLGEVGHEAFRFCGEAADGEGPYCADHAKAASGAGYARAPRNRRPKVSGIALRGRG